jgi:hypothetical protein
MFCGPQLPELQELTQLLEQPELLQQLHDLRRQLLLRFYLDQCYFPHAIEFRDLHDAPTMPYWWAETAATLAGDPCMLWVSNNLPRHYRHSGLDPRFERLRHNAAVFYCPDRIPVLIHLRQPVAVAAKPAQLWAFKRIRAAACKRWLAALRVIMSSLGPAIADCIVESLAAWHASLADADALPASALTYM